MNPDLDVTIATIASIPHGGVGSGCCAWCDPDLELAVTFWDGSTAVARRFRRSPLGKGFVRASVRFTGTRRWRTIVITPRDTIRRVTP